MTLIKDIINQNKRLSNISKIISELSKETQIEAYLVGGCVRDLMLNPSEDAIDVDIMVEGDGIAFAEMLAQKINVNKIVPFKKFATAKIPYNEFEIEIASARLETYDKSSRSPSKVTMSNIQNDLLRRDFTINAMAINIVPEKFGNLHDPYNGIKDLEAKKLITPLDPNKTFSEDPLRMIRAAYFASKLNLNIEKNCVDSMKQQSERISIVSQERITNEFCKILSTDKPSIGLGILQESGLMKKVFPEIDLMYGMDQSSEWHHKDIFDHTMQVVDNAALLSKKMKLRFAALVHDIAKPNTRKIDPKKGYTFHGHDAIGERMLNKVAERMKISNALKDYLKKLTRLHLRPIALAKKDISDSAIRRLMVAAGDDVNDLLTLCRADITTKNQNKIKKYLANFEKVEAKMTDVNEKDKMKAFQSPVRGAEIMKIFNLKPGKTIGKIKFDIEEAILDGKIENSYEGAYNYLISNKNNYIKK